jgi:Na+-translocating ferredoxin:NAD+ oxidoreductase RnfC subunit
MNTEADTASDMIRRLALSLDSIFQRAEELNASFERSPKPRQRKVVEILHKHGIPACVGPFFDTYSRISAAGGDIEQFSHLMVERLSYLQEDPSKVAIRFREAIADYVEFRSRDLNEGR